MMLPEVRVYRLLSAQADLISLMERLRGRKFDPADPEENGIFTYDVGDVYQKEEFAPFIRINPIDESPAYSMDDDFAAEEQTVQIDFWCQTASQSVQLKEIIDLIMKQNGHVQYGSKRYKDPDIRLLMNVRKYRVFDFNT